jgi:carbamoyltransferase
VCLLRGDEIIVAIQEERLLRSKRARLHGSLGHLAVRYCLEYAGITPAELSMIVLCAQSRSDAPENDLGVNPILQAARHGVPITTVSHHLGHAFAAFATSGHEDAAVLVVDGMGSRLSELPPEERAVIKAHVENGGETTSFYDATAEGIRPVEKHMVKDGRWVDLGGNKGGMPAFGSLGGMYGSVGYQIFGDTMDGAGKVMGLAPYGRPTTPAKDFFEIVDGNFVYSDKVPRQFAHGDRWPLRQTEYCNLAASVQVALEEALLYCARHLRSKSKSENLCYAGGVALNSVANERIIREAGFKNVFIMPAAEDSGTSIGAAYYGLFKLTGRVARRRLLHDTVGKPYSLAEVDAAIARTPSVQVTAVQDVVGEAVTQLCAGKIVGWFQGRSELGPRALGQRSILVDPRLPGMKDTLNSRVKHREGFRPFAPIILLEEANNWFELDGVSPESPFMLRIASFRKEKRGQVPAVVHVDGTGRIQTVTREANGRLYEVVREFHRRTGVPIVLNTSFNVAGEPIVETPDDALWCLLYTGLDCCILEDRMVSKRPEYRSILDLKIRVAADWVSVRYPVEKGEIAMGSREAPPPLPVETPIGIVSDGERILRRQAQGFRQPYVEYSTSTPWGSVLHASELRILTVLQHVNEQRTGRQVLEQLARTPENLDEAALIRLLGRLRRAGIISFHG